MSYTSFRHTVWRYYRAHGRHDLPWRKTTDPYKILVSEVMLQQTQVERVIPFYAEFTKRYPTAKKLAAAPLADVLDAWQGLGYNRRAKLLHGAATQMVERYGGEVPTDAAELESLWGIGPYTAHAVAAFAHNHDAIFVETNIRTVILHHFFEGAEQVGDDEILNVLKRVLPRGHAREWYSALMDYGAHLKRSGVKLNARSAHYTKQAKFEGSLRQVRGAIVRALTAHKPLTPVKKAHPALFGAALAALEKDGLIKREGRRWRIA